MLCGLLALPAFGQTNVILRLKNGDRLTGTLVSEDLNRVVVSNSWNATLSVPLTAIESREAAVVPVVVVAPPTNPPPVTVAVVTNPPVVAKVTPPPPKPVAPAAPKHWKARVDIGTDLLFGALDRQLYWGRLNFTYAEPYKSDPKKFFRTIFDYSAEFGKTEGVKSTDRMNGSIKVDFDIGKRLYLYNLGSIGYDNIRRIDLQYQVGPGLGYHLFAEPKFVMNVEGGLNYQVQDRAVGDDTRSVYGRGAEDLTWRISDRLTFTEKFEIFPNLQETDEFRTRLEGNLIFPLMKNLNLKLTGVHLYDTDPARNVDKNEVQIRSSVEVAF